jgi:hypothetical protein
MTRNRVAALLLVTMIWLLPSHGITDSARTQNSSSVHCPPLAPPTGNIVDVSTVSQLQNAVNNSPSGTTIRIADGTYNLDGVYLRFDTPGLTLRSASGNRDAVVLDGNYITGEIVQIIASTVTIADLTLREAYYHPIHVMSSDTADTENTLIYNVHIVDPGEQAIKINPTPGGYYPDNGVIACSHIELTDTGRPHIRNDCYTGGIDAHRAQGWVIRDNLIEGFWCQDGISEHGIHLWTGSRDTLVERNSLVDNARGVGFGLRESPWSTPWRTYPDDPCPGAVHVGHYGGIVRNNFVFATRAALFSSDASFDCGICLEQACGASVLHNTVVSTQAPASSSIEWRFSNTDADVFNNLVSHNLKERDGGSATLAGNLESASLSLFVDGAAGDLHLSASASSAIDQGVVITASLCDEDIDGDSRPIGPARDIGADEYGIPLPTAVADLRVTHGVTKTGTLTATLRWTAPRNAVTTTLRYSGTLIREDNWTFATLVPGTLPGEAEGLTTTMPYNSGMIYFALKSQNSEGEWSTLSNNGFWPGFDVWVPLVLR